ncbi:hypothetical protein [Dysgonomonas sp. 520]|uniref:hypothetical protein n=1 Tax=Dysgonomonas sp. 520 TaxID=2302931 RepID=UPI0013D7F164|nr:hypothetical protein [Dysgonomonas sp. 520]NDW10930.1 hypothetical protein [Dysgonomonas sp. 520]
MAYNRYNFLLRVKEVNELYFKYDAMGVTAERIYTDHVYPQYKISRTTFFAYLKIPYYKELEQEENAKAKREAARAAQLNLFDENENFKI